MHIMKNSMKMTCRKYDYVTTWLLTVLYCFCVCLYVQLVTVHVLDSTSVMVHQLVSVVVIMMVVIVPLTVG